LPFDGPKCGRMERVIQLLDELDEVAVLLGQNLGLRIRHLAVSVTLVLTLAVALLAPL
jgi:hypothetical protein